MEPSKVALIYGDQLSSYGFDSPHPFSRKRLAAFWDETRKRNLDQRLEILKPRKCDDSEICRFHHSDYLERLKKLSKSGKGFIDDGDTPAYIGVFEASSYVVGSALVMLEEVMSGNFKRAFLPIGGLHHAIRENAAGFCVLNDIAIVAETLRSEYGLKRIAYVDIDAHHGDGLYYPFEDDPFLIFADIHQDGETLYPGTGFDTEVGLDKAKGFKLNLSLKPGALDKDFIKAWVLVEEHLKSLKPELILFQCGADSLAGDPITQLALSEKSFRNAAIFAFARVKEASALTKFNSDVISFFERLLVIE